MVHIFYFISLGSAESVYQGLKKHQEVSSTPVTKVKKMIVVSWDLLGTIKKSKSCKISSIWFR